MPVTSEISEILAGSKLTASQQYDLAQQVIYINAIGNKHPVKIGATVYPDLTQVSRATLRQCSEQLISDCANLI